MIASDSQLLLTDLPKSSTLHGRRCPKCKQYTIIPKVLYNPHTGESQNHPSLLECDNYGCNFKCSIAYFDHNIDARELGIKLTGNRIVDLKAIQKRTREMLKQSREISNHPGITKGTVVRRDKGGGLYYTSTPRTVGKMRGGIEKI